jgi:hypothetical protein
MTGGVRVATRLGQQAIKHNLCHSYQAFNTCYTDTGLWGTYLVTDRIDDAMTAIQDDWYVYFLFHYSDYFFHRQGVELQQHVLILK